MTWTLKSGREIDLEGRGYAEAWLGRGLHRRVELWFSGCDCCGREVDTSAFTPEERREIADAVIACWNKWADTGDPG